MMPSWRVGDLGGGAKYQTSACGMGHSQISFTETGAGEIPRCDMADA